MQLDASFDQKMKTAISPELLWIETSRNLHDDCHKKVPE